MGKSLSVLKSDRQNKKKKQQNFYYKDHIAKYRKQIRKMVHKNESQDSIVEVQRLYVSMLDKATKKNILHKNSAARKKSRINAFIKKNINNNQ